MFIVPLSSLPSMSPMSPMDSISTPQQGNSSFAQVFEQALDNALATKEVSDQDAIKVALGQTDNLSQVMINSAKASTAMQMTVELTSRAVSSYKEIMQMQV